MARIGVFSRLFATLLAGASLLGSGEVCAEPGRDTTPTASKDVSRSDDPKAVALKHFERARELYRDGSYREAIVELESAHALDPEAKDLVYNLALVNEKLVRIDEALRWMHRYSKMDLDTAERTRSESTIRRLEGAKKTLAEAKPAEDPNAAGDRGPQPPPSPKMGRVDAFTIGAGVVAVVGLGVGAGFGISALSSRPKAGFVTGETGTYRDLEDQAKAAHTKATVADVGFGVFAAGAIACSLLYFARSKDPAAAAPAPPPSGARSTRSLFHHIAIAPHAKGATVLFTGAIP